MPNGRYQHRKAVYDKFNGHCAYCGKKITLIEMQIDHIYPKRAKNIMQEGYTTNEWAKDWPKSGNINGFDNLNPACRRCNHYKRDYFLEGFRRLMLTLHERIEKQYINKVAIDYGIITVEPWDGKFYFERINN